MTPIEQKQVQKAGRSIPPGTAVGLAFVADDPRSASLAGFCEQLKAQLPQLTIAREEAPQSQVPSLRLPNRARYLGVPQDNELPPFLEALGGSTAPLSGPVAACIHDLQLPAVLDLYVSRHCTFCPQAVRRLLPLSAASRMIQLRVIDAAMFPELAEREAIRAVPTLVVDGQLRWTGEIDIEEVASWLATRDPASLGAGSLEMMLKNGLAGRLAHMMAGRNELFPALLELLLDERWPIRLGAMVSLEELAAVAPSLAEQAMGLLWKRFPTLSDRIRGDIVFLTGEIGARQFAPQIEGVLRAGYSAELGEAAAEALEKLRS